jgi:hypothetical protein
VRWRPERAVRVEDLRKALADLAEFGVDPLNAQQPGPKRLDRLVWSVEFSVDQQTWPALLGRFNGVPPPRPESREEGVPW